MIRLVTDPVHRGIKSTTSVTSVPFPSLERLREGEHNPKKQAVLWMLTCKNLCPLYGMRGAEMVRKHSGWSWVKNVAAIQWKTVSEKKAHKMERWRVTKSHISFQVSLKSSFLRALPVSITIYYVEILKTILKVCSSLKNPTLPQSFIAVRTLTEFQGTGRYFSINSSSI